MARPEYRGAHQRIRRTLVAQYEAQGRGWPCALCGKPMWDPPRALHLAHQFDRTHSARATGWRRLAHAKCNLGAAGRLALARLRGKASDPPIQPRTRW